MLILLGALVVSSKALAADDSRPQKGQVVRINDIEMYYEIDGNMDGEPLLLLHGFTVSGEMWKPFRKDLGAHYKLIVPDLRGHGRSTNPTGKFTHRQAALDVFALLQTIGVKSFRAIGGSSGGMVLLHMATQQPDRLEAMVLVSATHYFPKEVREGMASMNPNQIPLDFMERLRARHKYGDGQIRAIIQQFHDFEDSYDDMNFTPPYLSTIKASTLIIHGDRDSAVAATGRIPVCRIHVPALIHEGYRPGLCAGQDSPDRV